MDGHGAPFSLFPVFLKLAGRAVVVVGGGAMAAARIPGLVAAGARVTVVAPVVQAEVAGAAVAVHRRAFHAEDLDGAWLVIAAAPPPVNRAVVAAAEARRVFVNAVDDAEQATAYTGGVLRRGGVAVALSTEGRAPALTGLLREALEAVIPDDAAAWVAEAQLLRRAQREAGLPMASRRPALLEALNRLYTGGPDA